jgi:undecaprenyl diphosphate synthase
MAHSESEIAAARAAIGVPDERIPDAIAIIMDGNGRWARQRGLPRPFGHQKGADVARDIIRASARLGLKSLTLYSFSIENWSRPEDEVNTLMGLYAQYLRDERPTLIEHNLRLRHLGRREGLPQDVLDELDESVSVTASNTGMYLCLALNYGSRAEIVDAVRKLARRVETKCVESENINEQVFASALDTAGIPDPDLVIRTAGEMRLSNFLLWQLSYAEFYVTQTFWPDFGEADLHEAIRDYAQRHRRFGGLDESNT